VGFVCSVCGEAHEGELRDIRMTLPEPVYRLGDEERERQSWVGEDSALLRDADRERHFVRGLLQLPIGDADEYFGYGVWVEVAPDDFETLGRLWHDPEGWRHEPFAGRLANEVAPYRDTVGLPVQLRLRDVDLLPTVELEDAEHPLSHDQRTGISDHHAHELAAIVA
jgi:hypothetical protein